MIDARWLASTIKPRRARPDHQPGRARPSASDVLATEIEIARLRAALTGGDEPSARSRRWYRTATSALSEPTGRNPQLEVHRLLNCRRATLACGAEHMTINPGIRHAELVRLSCLAVPG
jgi:hypothetical protein